MPKKIAFIIYALILLITSYVFAEQPKAVSESIDKNAADIYNELFSSLTNLPDNFVTRASSIFKNGWQESDKDIEDVVNKNKIVLDRFKQATKLTKCEFYFNKSIKKDMNTPMPDYLKESIKLARLAMLEGKLHENNNEQDLAVEDYLSVLRFSNHIGQQTNSVMFHKISEVIIQRMAYKPLAEYIKGNKLNYQDCSNLLTQLIAIRNIRTNLRAAIEEEKEFGRNTFFLIGNEAKKSGQYDDNMVQEFCREYNRLADEYLKYDVLVKKEENELKLEQLQNEINLETKSLNISIPKEDIGGFLENNKTPALAAKILMLTTLTSSAYPRAIDRYNSALTELDILITAAAVKSYVLQNSKNLDSLEELVPKYLSRIPADLFNDSKPLKYEKKDTGWVVYSIGPDKQDDRANLLYDMDNPDKKGDIVFQTFDNMKKE